MPPAAQKLGEISDAFRREQQMYSESQEQLQASIAQVRITGWSTWRMRRGEVEVYEVEVG
jgi:hypothetical protein